MRNGPMPVVLKVLAILAFLFLLGCFLVLFFGCATTGGTGGTVDAERVERTIETVQRIDRAITWIAPIACAVVAIAAPEFIPACHAAVASARVLQAATDQAIAAYRADPSARNAEAITDVLGKLKQAWENLDAAYKGDAGRLTDARLQSCIHPNVLHQGDRPRERWRLHRA